MCTHTYCKQSWSHVMFHVDIIKGHNLDKTLKGCNSHSGVFGLGGLTYNLHDEVTLRLKYSHTKTSVFILKTCLLDLRRF